MSVKDPDIIDGIGIEKETNTLVLLAVDPFDWKVQEHEHLKAIQQKMNTYVYYIEKKKYSEKYPDRDFDGFRIELVFKYQYTDAGERFLASGKKQLKNRGIELLYSVRGNG